MATIDATGLACPMPVIMAKKAFQKGSGFSITVDNDTAVQNLTRLGANVGATVDVADNDGIFTVTFGDPTKMADAADSGTDTVFFIGRDVVGDGDRTLGETLIKMMLYTLTQSETPPGAITLMNSGVKLASSNEECAEHLRTLVQMGCDVLVCGACLNYYALEATAGTVSNMADILARMQAAGKVITV